MPKQRKIIYNLIHLNQFKLFKTPKLHFYLDYKLYFLGDAFNFLQTPPTHIDLTTQSLNFSTLSSRRKTLKTVKTLQQFSFRLSLCYYKKLRFLGKGYKIKKSKKKKASSYILVVRINNLSLAGAYVLKSSQSIDYIY